jgi:hypothetical protein
METKLIKRILALSPEDRKEVFAAVRAFGSIGAPRTTRHWRRRAKKAAAPAATRTPRKVRSRHIDTEGGDGTSTSGTPVIPRGRIQRGAGPDE